MDFEDWEAKYTLLEHPYNENNLFETYGSDLDFVLNQNENKIWTLVDTDSGLYVVPGYHLVNRVNYLITIKPWKDSNEVIKYCDEIDNE